MAKEIERKFLVRDDSYKTVAISHKDIIQGYLNTDPDATVRVRVAGDKAFLTVKSRNRGVVRDEWEYPVPTSDAEQMLRTCCPATMLKKRRWIVPAGDLCWEVDEFHGRHEGLVLAEIELPCEDCAIALPSFIGEEVTGNPAYYNSTLSQA